MEYTCENCKNRHTCWSYEDCWNKRCEDFKLDESTLSKEEQKMLRVLRQVMRENNNFKKMF